MGCRIPWLLLLSLFSGASSEAPCALITPAVLRVGRQETIILDAPEQTSAFVAHIQIIDFPRGNHLLFSTDVHMNSSTNFLAEVKVQPRGLYRIDHVKQFVYINVNSSVCSLQKVLLLSYDSGYMFIQTDRPVYTPDTIVLYRVFLVDADLKPESGPIVTEILKPDSTIVTAKEYSSWQSIVHGSVKLPEFASPGTWTISARYDKDDVRYTTNFEVKLNTELTNSDVKVDLKPVPNYFPINDEKVTVMIHARYNTDSPLEGTAFVVFGIKKDNKKEHLSETLRQVQISNGKGSVDIRRKLLLNNFRRPDDLLAYTLYVTATVFSNSGKHMQNTRLENIPFVKSPFKIFLTQTPSYFTPGYYLDLKVLVTYPDGTPASRIPIVAEPEDVKGRTGEDGIAHMRINTKLNTFFIQITVKTAFPSLPAESQASSSFVATAKRQESGPVLVIYPSAYKISPKEHFFITITSSDKDTGRNNQEQYLTYLILNKGKIIRSSRVKRKGDRTDVVISDITEDFMPSFRIVAYYTGKTGTWMEIVSDSILVDVTDSCMGTLVVTGEANRVYRPDSSTAITVKADHKATVGVVAVQKRLYEHKQKLRILQNKLWDVIDKSDLGCGPGRGADNMEVFYGAGLAVQTNFNMETRTRADLHCDNHRSRSRRSTDIEIAKDEVSARTLFPESWYWKTEYMSEKPDKDGISTKRMWLFLKDSIETWHFLAISLSSKGICVAEPYEYQVRKDFFVDLKIPNPVPRNEEVEIQGVVYNYKDVSLKAKVILIYSPGFCSLSSPGNDHYQDVTIGPRSSYVVSFIIVPIVLGSCSVEVMAIVPQSTMADRVHKKMEVMPEGVQVIKPLIPIVLDPAVNDGVQEVKISAIKSSTYPKTNIRTILTVRGLPGSQTMEKTIDGVNLKHLMKPIGQSIVKELSMNAAALHYLDVTSQFPKIGVNYRDQALKYIIDGVTKQLTLSKPDFSYEISQGKPSTWLTAFVAKTLNDAGSKMITFDIRYVCGAIKWLILIKQWSDGSFMEDSPVSEQSMTGGVDRSPEPKTLLTAFLLIAMLETQERCRSSINNLQIGVDKAAIYLEEKYTALTTPYSIAMTSYALSLSGRLKNAAKLMSASTDNSHWRETSSESISIEGTSYALLTLLTMKQYNQTGPIVRWLLQQRFYGGESATQATILMFKALAQYHLEVPPFNEVDMHVSAKDLPEDHVFYLRGTKALVERTFEVYKQEILVTAKGKGQALLSGMTIYYEAKAKRETICKNFDLSLTLIPETLERIPPGAKQSFSINICIRHQKAIDAALSILNITLLTGFFPDVEDLQKLNLEPLVGRYEIDMETSERSSLIIFLNRIPHKDEKCFRILAHRYYDVGRIQPAPVTVSEYYAPESSCTAYYNIEEYHAIPSTICHNGECRCIQQDCASSQTAQEDISVTERLEKACQAPAHYVYKVTIADIELSDTYDSYVMFVDRIYKLGTDEVFSGESRKFIRNKKCWDRYSFAVGKSYLVWGKVLSVWDQQSDFTYIIDRDSWIEPFLSQTECKLPKNGKICDDLITFTEHLEFFGCHQE